MKSRMPSCSFPTPHFPKGESPREIAPYTTG